MERFSPVGLVLVSMTVAAVITANLADDGSGRRQITHDSDAPVAEPRRLVVPQDVPHVISLNATDPRGENLLFSIERQPKHGVLYGAAPFVTYRPATGYSGRDRFVFRVINGRGKLAHATVDLMVRGRIDAPNRNVGSTYAWPMLIPALEKH